MKRHINLPADDIVNDHLMSLCIISLNSSKSIMPSPLSSTSLITSSHTASDMFFPTPNASLSSAAVTEPLLSLSKNSNDCFSEFSSRRDSLLTHACINSWSPMAPLPSASTCENILLHSSYPTVSPYYSTNPTNNSSYCKRPSPLASSDLKSVSSLFYSWALIRLLTMRHSVACYSFWDTLNFCILPNAVFN